METSIKQPRKVRPGRPKKEMESSDTLPNVETSIEQPKKARLGRPEKKKESLDTLPRNVETSIK